MVLKYQLGNLLYPQMVVTWIFCEDDLRPETSANKNPEPEICLMGIEATISTSNSVLVPALAGIIQKPGIATLDINKEIETWREVRALKNGLVFIDYQSYEKTKIH
jgi:hypothetical protein